MPTDPKNLVLNEDEEKEWSEEEQRILEEKLRSEGNNITTILRLVGLLSGRTIQQITTRANWTLLEDRDKIPFELYKKREGKTEIQVVLPNNTKMSEIKKRPRQRHFSVIEETHTQKVQRTRRRSMSKENVRASFPLRTCLSYTYPVAPHLVALSSHESDIQSPHVKSVSPNMAMSVDTSADNNFDINSLLQIIQENESILKAINISIQTFNPLQPNIFLQFQNNLDYLIKMSHSLAYPTPLPYFDLNVVLTPELRSIGMKEKYQSPSYLNWNLQSDKEKNKQQTSQQQQQFLKNDLISSQNFSVSWSGNNNNGIPIYSSSFTNDKSLGHSPNFSNSFLNNNSSFNNINNNSNLLMLPNSMNNDNTLLNSFSKSFAENSSNLYSKSFNNDTTSFSMYSKSFANDNNSNIPLYSQSITNYTGKSFNSNDPFSKSFSSNKNDIDLSATPTNNSAGNVNNSTSFGFPYEKTSNSNSSLTQKILNIPINNQNKISNLNNNNNNNNNNLNIYSSSFPDNKNDDSLLSKSLPLSFILDKSNINSSNSNFNANSLGVKEKIPNNSNSNNNSLLSSGGLNSGFDFSGIKGNQNQSAFPNSNSSLRDDNFNMNFSSFVTNKMGMNNNLSNSRIPININTNPTSTINPFSTSLPSTNASFMNVKGSIIGQTDWTTGSNSLNFDPFLMKGESLKSNESSVSGESYNNDDNAPEPNDNIDEFELMLEAQLGDMMNNMDLEMDNQLNNYNNNNNNNNNNINNSNNNNNNNSRDSMNYYSQSRPNNNGNSLSVNNKKNENYNNLSSKSPQNKISQINNSYSQQQSSQRNDKLKIKNGQNDTYLKSLLLVK